jgi:hypothetical protein
LVIFTCFETSTIFTHAHLAGMERGQRFIANLNQDRALVYNEVSLTLFFPQQKLPGDLGELL